MDTEHVTREVLLRLLYSRSEEQNRITVLDSDIKALKAKIRETKKMVRFYRAFFLHHANEYVAELRVCLAS